MDEQDLLRKIGALLAKAEGTDNENEASAFFDKAHELMVRYAVEEERVRAAQRRTNGHTVEEPIVEDYMFSSYAHHAEAKSDLLRVVAKAHSVYYFPYSNRKDSNLYREGNRGLHESQWTRLVGYKSDIEHVKILYISLLIQSQRFAAEDWRVRYGDRKFSDEGLGKFTWLSGHMSGFAARIYERFRDLTARVYTEVVDSQALVLAKDANLREWMYEHHYAARPSSTPSKGYCWEKGIPPGKRSEHYCIKVKDHEGPHDFSYKPQRSYYQPKGRTESYEGREHGRSAADRADLGQPRMANRDRIAGGS